MDVEIKKSAWNLDILWRLNRAMWLTEYKMQEKNKE